MTPHSPPSSAHGASLPTAVTTFSSSSQQPESSFTPCPCSKHSGGFPSPFRINPDCPRRTTREPAFLPTGPPARPLPASPAVCEIAQPFPHGRLPAAPALPPLGTLAPPPPKTAFFSGSVRVHFPGANFSDCPSRSASHAVFLRRVFLLRFPHSFWNSFVLLRHRCSSSELCSRCITLRVLRGLEAEA